MDKKFTLTIDGQYYKKGTFVKQQFKNQYGIWYICIFVDSNMDMNFLLFLDPCRQFAPSTLKKLKINAKSQDIYGCPFEKLAIQVGSSSQYEFSYRIQNSNSYYKIDVEIDVSSLSECFAPPIDPHVWTNFTKKMFEDGKLADITIKTADGKEIKASKFILSRSPVFDAMLNKHDTKEAQEGVIEIADIKHEVMVELIRYMYCDEVPKLKEMALNLLVAANKYDLPGLVAAAEAILTDNINVENFAVILITADRLGITDLKETAINYIIDNPETTFDTADWKALKENNVQLGMEVLEKCFRVFKNAKLNK